MNDQLHHFSEGLADAAAAAGAAVVRVEGRRRIPATGVVWRAEGLIVTAHHVIERRESVTVGLPDGDTVEAEIVGRDATTDLAALRVARADLTAVVPANPDSLRVGQLVLALGRPGQSIQAALGTITALGGEWRSAGSKVDRYIQPDVVMYPGFSGGPLINVAGQIVGLNSSALARGRAVSLPWATVERVAQSLLAHGRTRRGYLGVSTQPARLPEAIKERLGQKSGLLIVAVEPDSPAEKGGLVLGDTIVAAGGAAIRHHDDLFGLLADAVDTAVSLQILRGGELHDLSVTVGERP